MPRKPKALVDQGIYHIYNQSNMPEPVPRGNGTVICDAAFTLKRCRSKILQRFFIFYEPVPQGNGTVVVVMFLPLKDVIHEKFVE